MKILSALATAVSGSIGGITGSHNRGGMYLRSRTIPINPQTVDQLAARNRLASQSSAWGALTEAQRLSWNDFAAQNPVADKLRQSQILTGQQTFVKINVRLEQATDTLLTVAPIGTAPASFTSVAATFDIGAGTTELTFAPDPAGTDIRLWLTAAVTNSAGIEFVKNLTRVITISAKDLASGFDYLTVLEAKFGTLQVGQKVSLFPRAFDSTTGLISGMQRVDGIVVSSV